MSSLISRPHLRGIALISSLSCVLVACVASPAPQAAALVSDDQLSAAVRASLPLLQESAAKWFEERSCVSCHHHTLGMMTVALAEERGFAVDRELFDEQVQHGTPWDANTIEEVLQGDAGINGQLGQGYKLLALAVGKVGAGAHTDARAMFLLDMQGPEGRWRSVSHRPPLEDCDLTATALSSRAIQLYAPPGNEARVARAVELARSWLVRAKPMTNEERTMQLFGLAWTGAENKRIQKAVKDLTAEQRPDGGWAQLETRSSDAYATGQALVALHQAGGLSSRSACYQRGLAYLLKERLDDGTWNVDTRRHGKGLPYFETGFPHGENQFIAYAASAWSTMAFTFAVQPGPSPLFVSTARLPRAAALSADVEPLPPLVRAVLYDSLADVRALLDAGADANQAGKHGYSALMAAVRDLEKAKLLLERGASIEARSALGFTALILAAGTHGSREVVDLLLQRGADVHARAEVGSSALWHAAGSGDCKLVGVLVAAGAEIDAPAGENLPALHIAVWQGDAAMVAALLSHGAKPDSQPAASLGTPADDGAGTALIAATQDGSDAVVTLLLEAGARVEASDELGRTALAWAAIVDWGNDRALQALLSHGASTEARDLAGKSVVDHARETGKASALALLEGPVGAGR